MTDLSLVDQLKAYFLTKKGSNVIQGTLAPAASGMVALGTADKKFTALYVEHLYADNITGGGSSSSTNADTVDGYHAATTPMQNTLLVLGENSAYPPTVYPQALLVTGERMLTGNLPVADNVTIDGVDLSAFYYDHYVNHAWKTALEAHRNGQNGEADLGVFVKAGRGLYNALDDGSVDPQLGHLNRAEIWLGLQTPGTLSVNSSNNPNNSHTHAIDASYDPGEASALLKSGETGELRLMSGLLNVGMGQGHLVGAVGVNWYEIPDSFQLPDLRTVYNPALVIDGGAIYTTGSLYAPEGDDIYAPNAEGTFWHLTIGSPALTDNLNADYLDGRHGWQYRQSDNYLAGTRGWKLFDDGSAEFQNIRARGRIESIVYSQRSISAISGQVLLSAGAKIAAAVASTDTSIILDTDEFAADDIIQVKTASGNEYMRIASRAELVEGGFRYAVVRNLNEDPAGPFEFEVGTACVRRGSASYAREPQALAAGEVEGAFGQYQPGGSGASSGGGWLVLDGESPFIAVEARKGPVWNQVDRVVQIGNLVGSQLEDQYPTETWGVVFGDANNYLAYDQTNGLRIHTIGDTTPETTIGSAGILTQRLGLVLMSSVPDYADHTAFLYMKNNAGTPEIWAKLREAAATVDSKIMLSTVYDSAGVGGVDKIRNQAGSPSTLQASSTRTANMLLALDASGTFPKETYPLAVLTDGTRSMTGDLRTSGSLYSAYNADGQVLIGTASQIELGKTGRTASGYPYIDFHSSPNSPDYDARIAVSGGSSTSGTADMAIYANSLQLVDSASVTQLVNGQTAFSVVVDGAGAAPTAGYKADIPVPFKCVITGWAIAADVAGSTTTYLVHWQNANYRTSSTNAATITLSSAVKNSGTVANYAVAAGDFLSINVSSATTLTRMTITIYLRKVA